MIPENKTILKRLAGCVRSAIPQAIKSAIWLLKLTIPVSFGVFLLNFFGILSVIAGWLIPLFRLLGLSVQAPVVLITSIFTNIYSVVAVMATLDIGYREGTILAVMCLISHALIVETAIMKKTGSSPFRMVFTRLSASFLAAWILNLLLPAESLKGAETAITQSLDFMPALKSWGSSIGVTALKIIILVHLLLFLQKILEEFDLIKWILMPFRPLLKVLGLPPNTGFLWMVAYTLGLSYGGAIMISQAEEGKLSGEEADLLNHHIAISHSQLEDTLLFVAVGYSFPILFFIRILLSILYVWVRRIELRLRSRQISMV